jgi:SAM-dependent methyltransferase
MAEQNHQTIAMALLDPILPLMPVLVDRLQAGIDVLDAGCGLGHSLNVMARGLSDNQFTGADVSAEGTAWPRLWRHLVVAEPPCRPAGLRYYRPFCAGTTP